MPNPPRWWRYTRAVRAGADARAVAFAGPDVLVCVLQDALLPAERAMVEMRDAQRVRESRTWFQVATLQSFIDAVEGIHRAHGVFVCQRHRSAAGCRD
jgi:hypothetical protein